MRRPPPSGSGMIRPRALGRSVEAANPPPAPTPAVQHAPVDPIAAQAKRKRFILILVGLVLLYFVYSALFAGDSDDNGDALGTHFSSSLREDGRSSSNSNNAAGLGDDDEEEEGGGEEEDEEEEKPKSSKKTKTVVKEEDEDGEEEEEGGGDADEEEEGEARGADDEEEEEEESNQASAVTSSGERTERRARGGGDPTRSIQSYFINFGGNVVEIDKEGSFKYVLIRMEDSSGDSALLVRSCSHAEGTKCKHHHAFSRAKAELELRGFQAKVRGGGRITRHPSRHKPGQKAGYISVFGNSKTFGACSDCNKIACTLIKAAYPDHGVKYSNEGYLESDERKIADSSWTKC